MLNEAIEMLEKMSEEEKQTLLETEFPAELEKEAAAELARTDLYEGLYAYGATLAALELEDVESLDKTAGEAAVEDEQALSEFIEEKVSESGLLDMEDEVTLHKTAQVAAAYLFAGYADALEKEANVKGKAVSHLARMGKFLKKHKGKAAAGAAGVAALGVGAKMAKRHMDKKASELTVDELAAEVLHAQDVMNAINDGMEKCAAKGKEVGKAMKGAFHKAVSYGKKAAGMVTKHPGKAAAGAAGVGLAGYMAKKHSEKKED